jgi:hypothetical protein
MKLLCIFGHSWSEWSSWRRRITMGDDFVYRFKKCKRCEKLKIDGFKDDNL